MINTKISSITSEFPQKLFTNKEYPFSKISNVDDHWIQFWGPEQRYMLDRSKGETAFSLAIKACIKVIDKSKSIPDSIDFILCNTGHLFGWYEDEKLIAPRISQKIKEELNLSNAIVYDIDHGCNTFLIQLQIANGLIQQGLAKKILICSSEAMSNMLDYTDKYGVIFGDGTCAALIEADRSNIKTGLLSSHYISDTTVYEKGRAEWRFPRFPRPDWNKYSLYFDLENDMSDYMAQFLPYIMPEVINKALDKINKQIDDIDFTIFHQNSKFITHLWAKRLNIPENKYHITIDRFGCLSSASVPNTLYEALKLGKIKKGDTILFAGVAIGWGVLAQIWKIPNDIIIY